VRDAVTRVTDGGVQKLFEKYGDNYSRGRRAVFV